MLRTRRWLSAEAEDSEEAAGSAVVAGASTAVVFAADLGAFAADSEGFVADLEGFAEASGALAASPDHSSGQVSGGFGFGFGFGLWPYYSYYPYYPYYGCDPYGSYSCGPVGYGPYVNYPVDPPAAPTGSQIVPAPSTGNTYVADGKWHHFGERPGGGTPASSATAINYSRASDPPFTRNANVADDGWHRFSESR